MRTVKLIISGRVQGVFFRKATKQKADELSVFGTVCNLADGSVEVVAQADAGILKDFIAWCHQGSMMARVDEVEIFELAANENKFNGFTIT